MQQNKKKHTLILLIALILSISMGQIARANIKRYVPVEVGNWWAYDVHDELGTKQYMMVVTQSENPVIITYFEHEEAIMAQAFMFYENRIDLIEELNSNSKRVQWKPYITWLMAGTNKEQWGYYYEIQDGEMIEAKPVYSSFSHIDNEDDIVVGAGTFSAQTIKWEIHTEKEVRETTMWVAEAIGVVKMEEQIIQDGEIISRLWELQRFGLHVDSMD